MKKGVEIPHWSPGNPTVGNLITWEMIAERPTEITLQEPRMWGSCNLVLRYDKAKWQWNSSPAQHQGVQQRSRSHRHQVITTVVSDAACPSQQSAWGNYGVVAGEGWGEGEFFSSVSGSLSHSPAFPQGAGYHPAPCETFLGKWLNSPYGIITRIPNIAPSKGKSGYIHCVVA